MRKIGILIFPFVFLAACGDSSSSASDENLPLSSSQTSDFSSSSFVLESSSAEIPASSESEGEWSSASSPDALPIVPDADGFYAMEEIYKATPATSKIVFVIRHAEREDSLGRLSDLTENGKAAARSLGEKLVGESESFFYASTDFVRTRETCRQIALGRGESDAEAQTWEGIDGGYFLKVPSDSLDKFAKNRGGTWKIISRWAYADPKMNENLASLVNAHFYDLFERGAQFVQENIVPNIPDWKRVSVLVSHDVLLEPLLVYATNRQIDLRFYESGRWANYLSGVAIVQSENGISLYPVRGMDVGYMTANSSK